MNWPACAATAESGCPTVAIVRSVSLPCVNSTGMEPVSPTALAPRSPAPPAFSASVARRDQSFMRGWLERSAAQGAGRSGETDLSGVMTAAVLVASAKKLVNEVMRTLSRRRLSIELPPSKGKRNPISVFFFQRLKHAGSGTIISFRACD